MPATRSAAMRTTRTDEPYPTSPAMPSDPDVIIISSDEEDTPPKVRRARKGKAKARRLGPTPSKEIIEISPLEGRGKGESSTDKIQKELVRYREKIAKYEVEIERAREEAMNYAMSAELAKREAQNSKKDAEKLKVDLAMEKAKARAGSSSTSTVSTELLDNVSTCEICQDRMWKPATLTDCGHTFCQRCLTDWFSTALAQHMAAHPAYNPNTAPPALDPALLAHLPAQLHPYLLNVVQNNPRPAYTCPACRAPVRTRPVACFKVRDVVHAVADALGEHAPVEKVVPRPVLGRATRGRAALPPPPPRVLENPWDGFFGRAR